MEFDAISRHLYATDAGLNQIEPLGVVSPRDTEDVVRLVEYAAEHGAARSIGRGMGSGLAGGAVGAGIQVDFTRYMNRVLEIAPDGSWARVQPGVVMADAQPGGSQVRDLLRPRPFQRELLQPGRHDRHQLVRRAHGRLRRAPRTTCWRWRWCWPTGASSAPASAPRTAPSWRPSWPASTLCRPGVRRDPAGAARERRDDRRRHAPGGQELFGLPAGDDLRRRERRRGAGDRAAARRRRAGQRRARDRLVHLQKLFVGRRRHAGPGDRGDPQPGAAAQAARHRHGLLPVGVRLRRGGARASSPSSPPPSRSWTPASSPSCASTTPGSTPCSPSAPTPPCSSSSRAPTTPRSTRSSPPCGRHLAGTERPQGGPRRDAPRRRTTCGPSASRPWRCPCACPGPRRALPFIEDVTVHPTEVPGYVDFLQRLFDREKVDAVMYGHVGDGNIHTRPLLDPKDPDDLRTMQRLYDEVFAYVRGHPGHHVGRARRRPAPHPVRPPDVRGRGLLPLLSGQECVRSPGRDEPRQEGRAAGGERRPGQRPAGRRPGRRPPAPRSAVRLRLPHRTPDAPPALPRRASTSARSRSATAAPSARASW